MRRIHIIEGSRTKRQRRHIADNQFRGLWDHEPLPTSLMPLVEVEINHMGNALKGIVSRSDIEDAARKIRSPPKCQSFHSNASSALPLTQGIQGRSQFLGDAVYRPPHPTSVSVWP